MHNAWQHRLMNLFISCTWLKYKNSYTMHKYDKLTEYRCWPLANTAKKGFWSMATMLPSQSHDLSPNISHDISLHSDWCITICAVPSVFIVSWIKYNTALKFYYNEAKNIGLPRIHCTCYRKLQYFKGSKILLFLCTETYNLCNATTILTRVISNNWILLSVKNICSVSIDNILLPKTWRR